MELNVKLIFVIILFVILGSIQYTLNLILKEIKSLRVSITTRDRDIEKHK